MRKIYLAFGSNLSLDRIVLRCPQIAPIGRATLKDWRLVFRGVADVEPADGCSVEGALYSVTPACEAALDRYEGFRAHAPDKGMYRKEWVRVRDHRGRYVRAFLYRMNHDHYDLPHPSYLDVILEGFSDWGIPTKPLMTAVRVTARKAAKRQALAEVG